MNKKLISIVFSSYNEEGNMMELARQLKTVFSQNLNYDFEVIAVENGSTDETYEKLIALNKQDPRFKIVQLARNFRMDGGITAGLQYATGHAAVIMTANLQDKPALITDFIKKWEEGYENIYGIVNARPGKSFFRRLNSELFYYVIHKLTDGIIPKNASDFRLIDRKVYKTINSMHERNRFTRGLFAWVGFKSIGIPFARQVRYSGYSHAPFWKVLHLAIQGIFSFSYVPIRSIAVFGFIFFIGSFIALTSIILKVLIYGVPFPGYGTIICLNLLMFGLLFLILGVIGEYLAQVYEEVKGRPNYIVSRVIGIENISLQ